MSHSQSPGPSCKGRATFPIAVNLTLWLPFPHYHNTGPEDHSPAFPLYHLATGPAPWETLVYLGSGHHLGTILTFPER